MVCTKAVKPVPSFRFTELRQVITDSGYELCGCSRAVTPHLLQGLVSMQKHFYVYILTNNAHSVFYTGVTNNLVRRVHEHKHALVDGFTKKYKLHKLVYYEVTEDVNAALHREKLIKKWKRSFKLDAIHRLNPQWHDLYEHMIKDPATRAG